jgi:tartrate-resistant acid phosphatase type 5
VIAPAFLRTPVSFVAPAREASTHVVAFGDYGTAHLSNASSRQTDVAAAMREYHRGKAFDFGLTTGDNFYPTAFASPSDSNWRKAWVEQYDAMGIPVYISVGNHDWAEPAGPIAQHVYSLGSRSFKLPALYYTFVAGEAQFFAINTIALTAKQLEWLDGALAASKSRFKIVYGHFPVFEQTDYTVAAQQRLLLPLFRKHKIDLYLAGHHHSLQHWQVDGIDYVITGAAGAAGYDLGDTTRASQASRKFIASRPGFATLEVGDGALTVRLVGVEGRRPRVVYGYTRRR